eukprot:m.81627 g.81627  ORF g.81627 m.81627 type:complete len:51 (-) comp50746_c2_seq2:42-194(-)
MRKSGYSLDLTVRLTVPHAQQFVTELCLLSCLLSRRFPFADVKTLQLFVE